MSHPEFCLTKSELGGWESHKRDNFDLQLTVANRGVHRYTAKVTDRAGNVTQTPVQNVIAYVRETLTLTSEAALDGCNE